MAPRPMIGGDSRNHAFQDPHVDVACRAPSSMQALAISRHKCRIRAEALWDLWVYTLLGSLSNLNKVVGRWGSAGRPITSLSLLELLFGLSQASERDCATLHSTTHIVLKLEQVALPTM